MLKKGGDASWARVCDKCRSAPCTFYCRADAAYLCDGCDAQIHAANQVASRHERVWVCQACERAPAAFLCKADAASLCATCDSDIHSANPLARRHHRVPILPIPAGSLYGSNPSFGTGSGHDDNMFLSQDEDEEDDEAASWLLLNPLKNNNIINNNNNNNNLNNGFLFGGDSNEYLDLVEYNAENKPYSDPYTFPRKKNTDDSIVPVQYGESKQVIQQHNFQLDLDYEEPSPATNSYSGSHGLRVSVSSLDVGVVPESTTSEISISHSRPPKGTIDLFSAPPVQMPQPLSPMDREARVLRYREKKKTRKFEKTIRYASRKAYAETRPRIKGRFAKRTNVEMEVDLMFSTTIMTDTRYGVVPSF